MQKRLIKEMASMARDAIEGITYTPGSRSAAIEAFLGGVQDELARKRWTLSLAGEGPADPAELARKMLTDIDNVLASCSSSPLATIGEIWTGLGWILQDGYELRSTTTGEDICPGLHHACLNAYGVLQVEIALEEIAARLATISMLAGVRPNAEQLRQRLSGMSGLLNEVREVMAA